VAEAGQRRWPIIAGLGTSQTLAWASSYYLIAILAAPMAQELGSSATAVFAAFSAALLLSAVLGPKVGRTIDRFGGREILAVSNLVFAAGLCILGLAPTFAVLVLGWLVMGIGMGLGLYDSAFAALGRIYGPGARSAITGITLVAGFASTVGWPLTAWGEATLGWRGTCLSWALAHIVLGLPLNLLVLPKLRQAAAKAAETAKPYVPMDRAMWLLGFAFAAGWVVSTAMAAHLPRLLEAAGASTSQAVAAAALVGPAQVAARVLEAGFLSRYHPLVSARLSTLTHPVGAGLLLVGGGPIAMPFTLLHGAGNGILTIARGTVPLAVFGPENYGYRLGLIGAPARILQSGAPLAFGALIDRFGAYSLIFSSLACIAATLALLLVSTRPDRPATAE
jgi:MFS family permease